MDYLLDLLQILAHLKITRHPSVLPEAPQIRDNFQHESRPLTSTDSVHNTQKTNWVSTTITSWLICNTVPNICKLLQYVIYN